MKQVIVFLAVSFVILSSCVRVEVAQESSNVSTDTSPIQVENQTGSEVTNSEKWEILENQLNEGIQEEVIEEENSDTWKLEESKNIKSYNLGEEISISFGEIVRIKGTDLEITFAELVSDSRCPEWVQCFWAWVAEILFKAMVSGRGTMQKLEVSPSWEGSLVYEIWNDFKVEILSLDPYPVDPTKIQESEYVLKMIILK